MTSWLRVDRAARIVLEGGVIAYPTEAVYGIGCLPLNQDALDRVVAIKRRDARKGLIVVAADIGQVTRLAEIPRGEAGQRIRADWPGPVTWILPARPDLPPLLTGGRQTIAVRVSDHPIVRRLCLRTGSALVSTSANFSGRRPARTALEVRRTIGREVDFILAGPLGDRARPTEIRDWRSGEILRAG
ncbi:MAG TPA: L-threonylcarbamoyladenylate synthase [Gammaproteobacteria bacterium]